MIHFWRIQHNFLFFTKQQERTFKIRGKKYQQTKEFEKSYESKHAKGHVIISPKGQGQTGN